MVDRLRNKTALVTAAGQGIGRAIAEAFVREGARVWATDLDPEKLDGLDGAARRRLDVLSNEDVERLIGDAGPLDILVNAAGFVHHGTILDCTEEEWEFAFDLNVRSMFRLSKALLPAMLQSGRGGSIINMSSAASSVKGAPNRFVYGATKAAVIGLTKAIAIDFIRQGIRCNAICPGTIQTPSLDDRIAAQAAAVGSVEQARGAFVARQPLGRLGTPEEIAALAVYLASDESAFTTGAIHIIDGGWSL